jgi:hypothetical protein
MFTGKFMLSTDTFRIWNPPAQILYPFPKSFMDKKDQYNPKNDPAAREALRDEANKPEPLYDKTDRNFQRQNQGPQDGTTNDPVDEQQPEGSSSEEEKDII